MSARYAAYEDLQLLTGLGWFITRATSRGRPCGTQAKEAQRRSVQYQEERRILKSMILSGHYRGHADDGTLVRCLVVDVETIRDLDLNQPQCCTMPAQSQSLRMLHHDWTPGSSSSHLPLQPGRNSAPSVDLETVLCFPERPRKGESVLHVIITHRIHMLTTITHRLS